MNPLTRLIRVNRVDETTLIDAAVSAEQRPKNAASS
jgi:hypothetical protein